MTNISGGLIRETPCAAFGSMYKLSVVYNGVATDELPDVRARREAREREQSKEDGICEGSNPGRVISPGESWQDPIYYDTVKSGVYEFTVEEKALAYDPGNSDIVKSNTLTIVIPEPQSEAPK